MHSHKQVQCSQNVSFLTNSTIKSLVEMNTSSSQGLHQGIADKVFNGNKVEGKTCILLEIKKSPRGWWQGMLDITVMFFVNVTDWLLVIIWHIRRVNVCFIT